MVDGGYFDNSGIVTALEIAAGVKTVDPRLKPFIVQVSSEPAWFQDSRNCAAGGAYSDKPEIPDEADFRPINSLADVLTVNATRIARGYDMISELPQRAKQMNGGVPSAAQFHVCPQPGESFFWDLFRGGAATSAELRDEQRRMQTMAQQIQIKSVSLSWWLSAPLQAYLDQQLYAPNNAEQRRCVLSLLKDAAGECRE